MNYDQINKQDLIAYLKKLHREKKYGLIWEEKPEKVDELMVDNYPVLSNITDRDIICNTDRGCNLLIEGDNLHSLYILNITHKNSVDLIYIDPPYNIGNKDFIYNDEIVDKEDSWKHSKWVSFMSRG